MTAPPPPPPQPATPAEESDITTNTLPPVAAPAAAPPNVNDYIAEANARAEAGRILEQGFVRGEKLNAGDHDRLADLVMSQAHVSRLDATNRIDRLQDDTIENTKQAENTARKAASFASLWIAFSLLFGAIVSMAAAVFARAEDDREAVAN